MGRTPICMAWIKTVPTATKVLPVLVNAVSAVPHGITLQFRQSNHEGVLVDWIQEARQHAAGLIINAAGLSYSSVPILDALLMFDGPIIEAHMSNIWQREPFRHHSMVSKAATGVIAGLGVLGYELAIDAAVNLVKAGAA